MVVAYHRLLHILCVAYLQSDSIPIQLDARCELAMPSIADLVSSIPRTVQECAKRVEKDDAAAAGPLVDILSSAIGHANTGTQSAWRVACMPPVNFTVHSVRMFADPDVAAEVLGLLLPELQSAEGRVGVLVAVLLSAAALDAPLRRPQLPGRIMQLPMLILCDDSRPACLPASRWWPLHASMPCDPAAP
jgi:hypothetical protein